MINKTLPFYLLLLSLVSTQVFAEKRLIAITLDDLPFVGAGRKVYLDSLINTIVHNNIPVTGFVIAGNVRLHDWALLHKFHDAGLGLGNHTFSHANLNKLNADAYCQEIDAADKILLPILTEPKFFRYPYLAMGKGEKRQEIIQHLSTKNYQIAPITIDSKDFIFNQLLLSVPEKNRPAFFKLLKPAYLDFIRQQTAIAESNALQNPKQAQILLLHANVLNAFALPHLIHFYKERGYEFISLEEALQSHKKMAKMTQKKPKITLLSKLESWVDWD